MAAELFMLGLTHKSCEISEGFAIQKTSETKIVIVFIDLQRYSPLCVDITQALCLPRDICDLWTFKQQMSSTVLEPDACMYRACIESVCAHKHKCTNRASAPS